MCRSQIRRRVVSLLEIITFNSVNITMQFLIVLFSSPSNTANSTRISSVADFLSETVCERTGELCNMNSKSGKQYKGGKSGKGSIRRLDPKSGKGTKKSYADECVKVSTLAPTTETMTPTATPAPFTTHPTLAPTMPWPTWMPTVEAKGKS